MLKEFRHDTNDGGTTELFVRGPVTEDSSASATSMIYIDAGTRHFRLQACSRDGSVRYAKLVPSNSDLRDVLSSAGLIKAASTIAEPAQTVITGKLAGAVRERLGCGKQVLPTAAFWLAAQDLIELRPQLSPLP